MASRTALSRLTERERQIAQLVARGCSNAHIAERLSISVQTVKNRLCEMYLKLGVKNRTELAIVLLRMESKIERTGT